MYTILQNFTQKMIKYKVIKQQLNKTKQNKK